MNTLLTVAIVLVFGWMGTTYFTETNIEKPTYKVIERKSGYEIRQYETYLLASTKTQGDFDQSLSQGFRTLAGYIFGGNKQGEKINMTEPVIQRENKEVQSVSFVVPKKYTLETLPESNDPSITFELIEAKKMAALSFNGYADEKLVRQKKELLLSKLKEDGYMASGNPIYASYNSPYAFPLLKAHEILVEIQ